MSQKLNPIDKTENIILSDDLLVAQVTGNASGSVRAVEPVPIGGVYFYEAKLYYNHPKDANSIMRFGWATKQCFLNQSRGIGHDQYSIGFDARNKVIWHKTLTETFSKTDAETDAGTETKIEIKTVTKTAHKIDVPDCKSDDIVGCFINVPKKCVTFYLNGKKFDVQELKIQVEHLFSNPNSSIYPAITFKSDNSKVYLNFGQTPFEFFPSEMSNYHLYQLSQDKRPSLDPKLPIKNISLSCDLFSARNNSKIGDSSEIVSSEKVFASKSVQDGIYYYEVTLCTVGSMQIGWSIKDIDSDATKKTYSIGFDGHRQLVWANETTLFDSLEFGWKCGDILGCLSDFPKETFIFYLNGKCIDGYKDVDFFKSEKNDKPYYPAITLTAGQQVYCNFGQEKFLFPPKEIMYQDFYGNRFNPVF